MAIVNDREIFFQKARGYADAPSRVPKKENRQIPKYDLLDYHPLLLKNGFSQEICARFSIGFRESKYGQRASASTRPPDCLR